MTNKKTITSGEAQALELSRMEEATTQPNVNGDSVEERVRLTTPTPTPRLVKVRFTIITLGKSQSILATGPGQAGRQGEDEGGRAKSLI